MQEKNLYDFADLSDLPAELQEALETQTTDNARKYADIVKNGALKGYPSLNIRQIEAVATRMFGADNVPTTATVRAYLNAAVKLKLIGKPTRNSYGADASVVVAGEDDEAGDQPAAPTTATDPLAGL